jgi:hypothetical protein
MWTHAQLRFEARKLSLVGFAALALATPGCVLGLETPASGPKQDRPPERAETPPPKPKACGNGCRWSPGYWHWDGGGYVWVEGHWEQGSARSS